MIRIAKEEKRLSERSRFFFALWPVEHCHFRQIQILFEYLGHESWHLTRCKPASSYLLCHHFTSEHCCIQMATVQMGLLLGFSSCHYFTCSQNQLDGLSVTTRVIYCLCSKNKLVLIWGRTNMGSRCIDWPASCTMCGAGIGASNNLPILIENIK